MPHLSLRAQRNVAVFVLSALGLAFATATVAGRVTNDDVVHYFGFGGPVPQGATILGGVYAVPDAGEPELLCGAILGEGGYTETASLAVFSNAVAESLPMIGSVVGVDLFAARAVRGTEGPWTEPVAAEVAGVPGVVIGYRQRDLVRGVPYEHDPNCTVAMARHAMRGDRLCVVDASFLVLGDPARKGLRFKSLQVVLGDDVPEEVREDQRTRRCPTQGAVPRWDVRLRSGLAVIDGREVSPT